MIVDTHIHLDHSAYFDDLDLILHRAKEAGVKQFVIPGADPATLPRAVEIAQSHPEVYFAVGVHPYDKDAYSQTIFETYLAHSKCIAVGECGLDYYRLEGSEEEKLLEKQKQAEIFRQQIRIAIAYQMPLIVHIRDASTDARRILEEEGAGAVGGVLHCYNADEQLLPLANHNFYFGIGGVVTFKNAKKLVNVLPKIPREKLLLETDGPYLTPHPYRGKRNEPAYTQFVAEKVAQLLEVKVDDIKNISTHNASTIFKQLGS